jgi:hypothetical protein
MFPRLLTDKTKAGLSSLVIQSSGVPVIDPAQAHSPVSPIHPAPGNLEK